ncbi:MAG: response regulator [Firmicutes bacterium]|nr:response regulator [Bacillota bacterium]
MNILLVDDERHQLETIQRGMRIHGHQVITAESAEEALEILRKDPETVHLVITDFLMTGMNGLNLLRNIRDNFGDLPVILMTAYGDQNLVVEAMRNKCDDYIDKPFKPKDLMEQVDKIEKKMGKVIPFPGTYQPEAPMEEARVEAPTAAVQAAAVPAEIEAAEDALVGDPLKQIGMGWTIPVFKYLVPAAIVVGVTAVMVFQFVMPFFK